MSEKKRSAVFDYLAYLGVRILVCVFQALPFDLACRLANGLAWVMYKIDKRHREAAVENFRIAFPGRYSEAEIDLLVRAVFRHFCVILIEFMHLPRRFHLHNYKQFAQMHEGERLVQVLLSGRPVLFVTGHFGNWEMGGYALGLFGIPTHSIARPLDNPYLDDFLRSLRERSGQKLFAKRGDFENIEKLLASGGKIATLGDQDAGQRGLFVDFFGCPASTHKAVALLALEHNVPMVVVGTPKIDGIYRIWAYDAIFPEDYQNAKDPVREITERFTKGLEAMIRQAPEQYFWLHRRWKHTPPERRKKKKAPLAA